MPKVVNHHGLVGKQRDEVDDLVERVFKMLRVGELFSKVFKTAVTPGNLLGRQRREDEFISARKTGNLNPKLP